MFPLMRRWCLVTGSTLALGCAASEQPPAAEAGGAPVDEIAVRTAIDADSLSVVVAIEELRIGHADDPRRGFNSIRALDVDREGQIYVYDRQARELRVFARDGRFARTIGRGGSGPGEFGAYVSSMGVFGDTVWTIDNSERKVNVFDRRGKVVSSNVMPGLSLFVRLHGADVGLVELERMDVDGRLIATLTVVNAGDAAPRMAAARGVTGQPGANDTVRVPRISFRVGSEAADTIGWEPVPPHDVPRVPYPTTRLPSGREQMGIYVEVGGNRLSVPIVPGDVYHRVSMLDGSSVVWRRRATSDRPSLFEVARYSLDGSVRHRLKFRYAPRRYDDAVLDTMAMRAARQRGDATAAAFKAIRGAMKYPEFQSPIYDWLAANDSSLWLRREDNAGANHRWIVIGVNGTVRGVVEIPRTAAPIWASGESLVAVDTDERGVPWVVRYRLAWQ